MSGLLRRRKLGRSVLAIALALLLSVEGFAMPVLADAGNNDPWGPPNSNYAVQVPGTPNSNQVILWGYTTCPSSDTNCMAGTYVGSDGHTYGWTDPWRYALRYCTSWVAWALHDRNHFEMPQAIGDASNWKSVLTSAPYNFTANSTPAVGAIAWYSTIDHVAWVSALNSDGTVQIEEYNNPAGSGAYNTRAIAANSVTYIHVSDINPSPAPSTPTALSRASTNMAVFYNDQNGNLVNWSWDSVNGWSSYSWADSGGINGQIAAVTRTSDSMDVFYRTGQNKLVYKAWTASGGWVNPYPIVSSGVVGDPAVSVRDSNHMQVFYRDSSGNMDSIGWNTGTWDASPQTNYNTGAAGDPAAISRTSDSMDVFFVKNNQNLVHLGWTAANGWNTSDWTTYMQGKPAAMKWNGSNDMAAFYEQINGNVGEESWDSSTGWAAQTWAAALSGNPSAVAGISNTIDNFYREIDGKVSDRYLSGSSWNTTNIVNAGGSTSNPYAINRGTTSQEVFYWDGSALMDNNWNTTSHSWNGGVKINN